MQSLPNRTVQAPIFIQTFILVAPTLAPLTVHLLELQQGLEYLWSLSTREGKCSLSIMTFISIKHSGEGETILWHKACLNIPFFFILPFPFIPSTLAFLYPLNLTVASFRSSPVAFGTAVHGVPMSQSPGASSTLWPFCPLLHIQFWVSRVGQS